MTSFRNKQLAHFTGLFPFRGRMAALSVASENCINSPQSKDYIVLNTQSLMDTTHRARHGTNSYMQPDNCSWRICKWMPPKRSVVHRLNNKKVLAEGEAHPPRFLTQCTFGPLESFPEFIHPTMIRLV